MRKGIIICVLSLMVLGLCGCASPVIYYKPSGNGALVQSDRYALNHKNRFEMQVAQGVQVQITADRAINTSSTYVSIQVNVQKGTWVQFVTDALTLTDDKGKVITVQTGPTTLTNSPRLVTEKFEGGNAIRSSDWGSFNLDVVVPAFQPKAFTLQFPDMIVIDQRVKVPPILYTVKRGIKLYYGIAT